MLNRIFVVDSVTLSSTGTAVSSYVPWEQTTRKLPTQVVVKATGQGAYVRLSNDNSAATNVDVLVQGGDHVVLSVQGRRWVSVLSDGASSTVSVGALSTGVSGDAASLSLDFAGTGTLDPRVTFTRASTGTFFNSAGVLTSAATNAPRFDYNPSTLAARGLRIEEQRTNSIRNNTMQGAVAGTPGTPPTNWALTAAGGNITSLETVSVGTENGIQYIDVKYVFSGAATANVRHETIGQIAATNTQTWTASAFVKLVGGSTSNITTNVVITQYNAAFAGLEATSVPFTPLTTALGTSRPSNTKATTQATVASVTSAISIVATGAADITLRIGLPQLELGAFATSVIPTTTMGLTRNADEASVNTLSPWFNASEGTLYGEVSSAAQTVGGVSRRIANINDGTEADRITVGWAGAILVGAAFVTDNSVTQAGFNSPSGAYPFPTKVALAYKTDDFQAAVNGSAFAADTSGTVPTVTQMRIGDVVTGGTGPQNLNGHVRRITYYPRRLSQAELTAITT